MKKVDHKVLSNVLCEIKIKYEDAGLPVDEKELIAALIMNS